MLGHLLIVKGLNYGALTLGPERDGFKLYLRDPNINIHGYVVDNSNIKIILNHNVGYDNYMSRIGSYTLPKDYVFFGDLYNECFLKIHIENRLKPELGNAVYYSQNTEWRQRRDFYWAWEEFFADAYLIQTCLICRYVPLNLVIICDINKKVALKFGFAKVLNSLRRHFREYDLDNEISIEDLIDNEVETMLWKKSKY